MNLLLKYYVNFEHRFKVGLVLEELKTQPMKLMPSSLGEQQNSYFKFHAKNWFLTKNLLTSKNFQKQSLELKGSVRFFNFDLGQ